MAPMTKVGTAALVLLVAILCASTASAASYNITWILSGNTYPSISVTCGDQLTFMWPAGIAHGVALIPSNQCPTNFTTTPGVTILQAPAAGPNNYTAVLGTLGQQYFACPVITATQRHCDAGMLIGVLVRGVCPNPPPPPTPPPPSPQPPPPPPASPPPPPMTPVAVAAVPASAPAPAPSSASAAVSLSVMYTMLLGATVAALL